MIKTFDCRKTGILITRDERVPVPNAPSDFEFKQTTIYAGLARVLPQNKLADATDKNDKRDMIPFIILLDREFQTNVRKGDKLQFRIDQLADNLPFSDSDNYNTFVGFIHYIQYSSKTQCIGRCRLEITTMQ